MNRRLVRILAISIILTLAGGQFVFAQKSRSRRAASSRVKKDTRKKRPAVASRKGKRSRKQGRVSSRRRGRVASRSQGRARSNNETQEPAASAPQRMPSGIPAERIIEIQTALSRRGYYEGPPSGQWDEMTVEAMKQFQIANRLAATGLPSAATLKKLGVSKTSNDGYSVPVKSVSQDDKRPEPRDR